MELIRKPLKAVVVSVRGAKTTLPEEAAF